MCTELKVKFSLILIWIVLLGLESAVCTKLPQVVWECRKESMKCNSSLHIVPKKKTHTLYHASIIETQGQLCELTHFLECRTSFPFSMHRF